MKHTDSAKARLFTRILPELAAAAPYFHTDAVKRRLGELGVEIEDSTFRQYMSEAMSKGVVHDAGRGWYSRIESPCKLDPKPVAKLVKLLEKEFPLLDFTCWSTQQINPWMHHILAKFLAFVNVDRDGLSAVADFLGTSGYEVHGNPGTDRASEVRAGDRAIVVRPLNATAPREGHFAPPEAVLVDLCVETRALMFMSPGEFKEMAQALAASSCISIGSLLQYAGKRELTEVDLFVRKDSLMEES